MNQSWKHAAKSIALTLMLTTLSAGCSTTTRQSSPIPIIVGESSPMAPKAVPCAKLREISFAAPETPDEEDLDNQIDTLETIADLRSQNAVINRLCRATGELR